MKYELKFIQGKSRWEIILFRKDGAAVFKRSTQQQEEKSLDCFISNNLWINDSEYNKDR